MLSMFLKFNHQIWIFQEEQARKDIEKHHFYHIWCLLLSITEQMHSNMESIF